MVGLPATPHPPSRKELHQPPCIPDIPPPPPPSVLPALEFLEGQCGGHVPLPTAAHTCPAPRRVTDSSSSFLRARIGARGPPRLRSPACLHLCLDLASWPPVSPICADGDLPLSLPLEALQVPATSAWQSRAFSLVDLGTPHCVPPAICDPANLALWLFPRHPQTCLLSPSP